MISVRDQSTPNNSIFFAMKFYERDNKTKTMEHFRLKNNGKFIVKTE